MKYCKNLHFKVLLFALIIFSANAHSVQVDNGDELRKAFNLSGYIDKSDTSKITVAVLDKGFGEFEEGKGFLPSSTIDIIKGPVPDTDIKSSRHGLEMAQIIWEITGKKDSGPRFLLFQAGGLTNLRAAISKIINGEYGKVDVVLHSINYTSGGNFDGQGFINEEFNKLVRKGITVINAAGNFKDSVYRGPVKIDSDNFLKFEKETELTHKYIESDQTCKKNELCFYNEFDKNMVTISLSWNDFKNFEEYKTKKDLDLYLFKKGEEEKIAESISLQKGEAPRVDEETNSIEAGDNRSSHARERIKVLLNRGWYRIKTRYKSIDEKDFSQEELDSFSEEELSEHKFKDNSKIRIALTSAKPFGIYFQDRTIGNEIMIPGDNPYIITVGDTSPSSSEGEVDGFRSIRKPDVVLESKEVYFSDGINASGTSSSAAIFAGLTVLLKGASQYWTTENIQNYSKRFFDFNPSDKPVDIDLVPRVVRMQLPEDTKYVLRTETLFTVRGYMDFDLLTAIVNIKPENLPIFRHPQMVMRYNDVTRLTGIQDMSEYYIFLTSPSRFSEIIPRRELNMFLQDHFRVVQDGAPFNPVNEINSPVWEMPDLDYKN